MKDAILTTLASTTTTATNNYNGGGVYISNEQLTTTVATSLSTATLGGCAPQEVHAEVARSYVCSMSDEEIDSLLMEIDEQEEKIVVEVPKVKKIGALNNE